MTKKVVIITGASSGIVREAALFLAKNGYTVYGMARRIDKLREMEGDIKILQLDVTDEASMTNCVSEVFKNENRIDVLINNAGYGEYGAVEDVSIANAKKQMEVNLFGAARMAQLVLPYMRRQKSGKIVNISSIGGKMATPMGGWYHASKFALEGLSDSLRMEVKQFGIDVIVIEPGGVRSEWSTISMSNLAEASENSEYANIAKAALKTAGKLDEKQSGSHPIVIARLIKKAIEYKHPKARYAKGAMAKPILLMKKILNDALFDKLVLSQFSK
jgi:short-subunit dehydrogenase